MMSRPVKRRRPYDSPRRRQQAEATRAEILGAAQRLFERDGYAATSMAAVAAEAGVALKTVYVAFATKRGLLLALWHLLLRGDEEPSPVGERPWFREIVDEPDPQRKLRLLAHSARLIKERVAGIWLILRDAAPTDAEIADLWARIQQEFHAHQGLIVESIPKRALRRGVDAGRATDLLWTLNHPSLWWLLVGERKWTPDEYETWLADAFCEQLLRPTPASAAPGSP